MDILNVSGLNFRVIPNVTVRMILEVFRFGGQQGFLQRDGIVEYLDSPIEFDTVYPYVFIPTQQILIEAAVQKDAPVKLLPIQAENVPLTCNTNNTCSETSRFVESRPKTLYPLTCNSKTPEVLTSTHFPAKVSPLLAPSSKPVSKPQNPFDVTPVSYEIVEVRADKNKYLHLNQIEVYNEDAMNIADEAILESSGYLTDSKGNEYLEKNVVNKECHNVKNMFHSLDKGGWIKLKFLDRGNITNITLRNRLDDLDNKSYEQLMFATLKLISIDAYVLLPKLSVTVLTNAYADDEVSFIEIVAPATALPQLNQLTVFDTLGSELKDYTIVLSRSEDEKDQFIKIEKQKEPDFDEKVIMRLVMKEGTFVKSVTFPVKLTQIQVFFAKVRSFNCTSDMVQTFYI